MKTVFADTSFWIAWSKQNDQWFEAAIEAFVINQPLHIVTTEEVLSEYLAAMSRAGKTARQVAAARVIDLLDDPDVTVYAQSHETFIQGLELYRRRLDKSYSLVDCISMRCMADQGIREVLTTDRHFTQEGFVPLMLG